MNQSSSALTTVIRMLVGELNRRVRRKPTKPVVLTGAGRSGTRSLRTKAVAMLSLMARAPSDPPTVEAHDRAGDQRDQEIHAHGDADDFDRLPGLAQRGSRKYRDQIGIADPDRQRRVLGQIEVLVGERRQDHPQRLRHHDQPQHRAARQPERRARFHLSLVHRQDAGAHDLGDEGRGIGRQRQRQRHEFRNDARAAGKIETLEDGHLKRYRRAEQPARSPAEADQQAQRIGPDLRSPCRCSNSCRRA